MTDLQCAAIIVLLTPETVVAGNLRDRRLSGVIVASSIAEGSRALADANRLATDHGCQIESADMADGAALVHQIEDLADLYRGETVAVVASSSAVCDALEWTDAPAQPVAIAIDSTGRNVLSA